MGWSFEKIEELQDKLKKCRAKNKRLRGLVEEVVNSGIIHDWLDKYDSPDGILTTKQIEIRDSLSDWLQRAQGEKDAG